MKKALPAIVLVVGLALIGGLAVALAPDRSRETAPSAIPPAPKNTAPPASGPENPDSLSIRDRRAASPSDALMRAQARALRWDRDAVLASITIEGATGPTLDLTSPGARMRFEFGRLSGEGFGVGAGLEETRLFIEAAEGDTASERPGRTETAAALEPKCPFEKVVKAFHAAGLDPNSPATITYQFSERYRRSVWSTHPAQAPARFADGQTCALLVR